MKKILFVLFLAACFTFQHYAESLADENKTITPQEFASNVAQVPGKLVTFIGNEVEKTKEYQAKSWAEMKTKWPFTMFTGNKDESQN